jgi:hypothetical protein
MICFTNKFTKSVNFQKEHFNNVVYLHSLLCTTKGHVWYAHVKETWNMPPTLIRFKKKLYTRRDSTKTFDHGCREDSTNAFSSFSHRGRPCTQLCKCTHSPCSLNCKQFSFTLFIHSRFFVHSRFFLSFLEYCYQIWQRQMTNHQTDMQPSDTCNLILSTLARTQLWNFLLSERVTTSSITCTLQLFHWTTSSNRYNIPKQVISPTGLKAKGIAFTVSSVVS